MNKSLITNLSSIGIITLSYVSPIYSNIIFNIGIFAFSGSLTNWLAIHMLFEKIPLFYGSGVIPNRFREIKSMIKKLILEEFFYKENIQNFLNKKKPIDLKIFLNEEERDKIFLKLVEAIEDSSLSGMLNILGGKNALMPLKEPMIIKIIEFLDDFQSNKTKINDDSINEIKLKIEEIIDERLNQLNPIDIKIIIQDIIKKHLNTLSISDIKNFIKKVNELELLIKRNSGLSNEITNNFILEIIDQPNNLI